jgi:hypothetical protein
MTLATNDFIRRFLSHVLPGGIGPPPPSINGANFRDLTQFTVAATAVFYLIVLHEAVAGEIALNRAERAHKFHTGRREIYFANALLTAIERAW